MQQIRRKSLARLRREIEPVEQRTYARLTARWQGVTVRRRGLESLLDSVENLQGAALLASELEREILPSRIANYRPSDLDAVMAAGEVVWVGVEQVGVRDGRVALYLSESLPLLFPPQELRGRAPRFLSGRRALSSFWPGMAPLFCSNQCRHRRRISGRNSRRVMGIGVVRPDYKRYLQSSSRSFAPTRSKK